MKTLNASEPTDFDPSTVTFSNPTYNYLTDTPGAGTVDDIYFKSIFIPALNAMKDIINTGIDQINK